MIYKGLNIRSLLLVLGLFASHVSFAGDTAAGKTLFMANCASCHAVNMTSKSTGPALKGVEDRWEKKADLYAWIRNSQALIASGHSYAKKIYDEYKGVQMNAFPNLTDADIDNLLAFINGAGVTPEPPTGGGGSDVPEEKANHTWFYALLLLILVGLAYILSRIITNLGRLTKLQAGENPGKSPSLLDQIGSKGVIGFVTFLLVLVGSYLTVDNAIKLGRQQNYQPDQPINFSHTLHAGKNGIDCQYCHDGARRSKHSFIPGASTCMNCHSAVQAGQHKEPQKSAASSAEIMKIYAAAGFDPNSGAYFNLDSISGPQIKTSLYNWLSAKYKEAGLDPKQNLREIGTATDKAYQLFVDDSNGKPVLKPINWVKIHNLPDHVYFNHSQHVVAGGLQCQTCHGQVEKMDVVKQYSPLSMGWCVNCHRKSEVRFSDNPYYSNWEVYHQQIKEGKRTKVTVEDIGGLECQKCHY